jgi:hypothetical protein
LIPEAQAINLLWTGGWDSTFRLLQLLILQNKTVQPHYLIDADRKSTFAELYTMRNIKREIFSRFPNTKERLYPSKIVDIVDLPPDLVLRESFLRLWEPHQLGCQYEWLACYSKKEGLQNIELGITQEEYIYSKIIGSLLIRSGEGDERIYLVDNRFQGTDEYTIFGWYHFPLLCLNKRDMQKITREEGLLDILQMTWFCHTPRPNYTPCGICVPCSFIIEKGMGWRVPMHNRIKYYLIKFIKRILLVDKIKQLLKSRGRSKTA